MLTGGNEGAPRDEGTRQRPDGGRAAEGQHEGPEYSAANLHSFNDGSHQQQLIDSIQNNEIYEDANMDLQYAFNYASEGPATRRFDFGAEHVNHFNSNDTNIL